MKAFFEGIQWLFENIIFIPHNYLRNLELEHWFAANIINWIFIIICAAAMVYWIKKLKLHKDNGEENQDTTAHSFLK
ncbi:MAG: uracil phosphoribosyltransferase [Flavobacteriaceae bacterium]|nr:uracil phosphoribosyltransferase [Flavobacteriaceae bacterium]